MVCDVRRRRPSARYSVLIAFAEPESYFGAALASGSNRTLCRAPSMLVRRLEAAAKPPCHTITMNIYLISDCSHEYVRQMTPAVWGSPEQQKCSEQPQSETTSGELPLETIIATPNCLIGQVS